MFSLITKKHCPLLILLLAFGCGKNIKEAKTSNTNHQVQNQGLSSNLALQVDEAVSATKLYKIPRNAWFKLPTKLFVQNGDATGKEVKIYYNLLGSSNYEFECTYFSTNQVGILAFEKCESKDGYEIISNPNDLKNKLFPMDKGSSVKLQLTNPSGTGIKIESIYFVEWK